ncbi:hypothetical protein [Micromonospora sp. C95]|uniref:hypothetical protein n=1 Tax=Micromonospora sp. C95 TaxID=2824882 RepID=UPI001B36B61B|nr:hypothetical protein [Micromonospora sp. C95]MBQ1022837.1 hypothetical protein [Micromonospora sp. C95]
MPRHPDTVITPNRLLVQARQRLTSPHRPGQRMSRAELADAINTALDLLYPGRSLTAHYVDHRWVGKLERGEHRWPSRERRTALRHVLGATTDTELGLYSPRRTPDAIRSGHVPDQPATRRPLHVRVGGKLLDGDPEAWLHALDEFTNQPMRTWPQLRGRVQEYLEVLDDLQGGHGRPHLARVDARWSEFMSWIADNTAAPEGWAWLDRSHRRAIEADDASLAAYTLMRQSQRALDNGDVRAAIVFSRRSLAPRSVPARTRALCLTRMAEALAASGDDEARTAIMAAQHELPGVDANAVDEDDFARHCDPRYVAAVDARCRHLLGDPASATTIFEELLSDLAAIAPIDAGLWHAHLAECYLHYDPERAADHGMSALRLADEAASYRVIRATQPLAIALRRHSALPSARTFIDRHRTAVTTQ